MRMPKLSIGLGAVLAAVVAFGAVERYSYNRRGIAVPPEQLRERFVDPRGTLLPKETTNAKDQTEARPLAGVTAHDDYPATSAVAGTAADLMEEGRIDGPRLGGISPEPDALDHYARLNARGSEGTILGTRRGAQGISVQAANLETLRLATAALEPKEVVWVYSDDEVVIIPTESSPRNALRVAVEREIVTAEDVPLAERIACAEVQGCASLNEINAILKLLAERSATGEQPKEMQR